MSIAVQGVAAVPNLRFLRLFKLYLLMAEPSEERRQAMLEALAADIARHPVHVKAGRSVPRYPHLRPRPCNEKTLPRFRT